MEAIAQDFAAVAASRPHPEISLVKRIWLLLYAEGGRWTSSEIGDRLRYSGTSIYTTLREMFERNQVVRIDGANVYGDNVIQYAVTRACLVPRGVAVIELQEVIPAPAGQEQVQ